jgi:hypothetical protein
MSNISVYFIIVLDINYCRYKRLGNSKYYTYTTSAGVYYRLVYAVD